MDNFNFRDLLEALPQMVWSTGADGIGEYYNRSFQAYAGMSLEELRGWGWAEFLHPDDRQPTIDAWTRAFTSGGEYYFEYRLRRAADGAYRWHAGSASPIRDEAGTIVRWVGTCTDIDDRKVAHDALRETAENLSLSMQVANAGAWEWHAVSGEERWSPELYTLYMVDPQDPRPLFEVWQSLLHPNDRETTLARLDQALRERTDYNAEFRILRGDGQLRWISARGRMSYDDLQRPVKLNGISIDISERKQLEAQLLASEERFRSLMELSPDIISIVTEDGTLAYNSPAALAIHGYTQEEMIGRNTFDLIHPDDQPLCTAYTDRIFKGLPSPSSVQYRYRNKDGSYVWMEATAANQFDNPHIRGLIVISRDISERKRVQEALLLKNLVFDQSLAANSVSDRDGVLTEVNKAFLSCWGYESKEEVIGKPIPHFLADPGKAEEIVEALMCSDQWEGEYSARRKDGSLYTAHGLATVVRDEHGAIVGFQSSVLDVTARKCAEAALALAKEVAEAANRAKSEFLANMSHEIRTPINGIMGMTQLLEYTELSADQREYLDAIRSSSDSLLALINDILDLSKIEAGRLELERREFSLRANVSDVVKSQISLIHAKGLTLRVDIPASVPDNLTGDPLRLKQILLNLVGNAVKFTERGGITLAVSVEERHDDVARFRFTVADTGIGIKPEAIEKLFAPFSQADSSTTRQFGGTGLGLSICTRLTALMDGTIGVESREGAGSTFHVQIPFAVNDVQLERNRPSPVAQPTLWEGRSLQVLLAEDNDAGRKFFTEVLRKYGHRVDLAQNGAEALKKWSQANYDLILMDVQMPVMDGVAATGRIRRIEQEKGGHVPVIALTAHAMEDDRPNLLAQGFDGYVAKPTKIRELFREMKRCLHGEQ